MGFYRWISILPEIWGIHYSKFPLSSLVIFTSEIKLLTSLDFHAILGSVNTAVNTEFLGTLREHKLLYLDIFSNFPEFHKNIKELIICTLTNLQYSSIIT